jgi:hypothetical protein
MVAGKLCAAGVLVDVEALVALAESMAALTTGGGRFLAFTSFLSLQRKNVHEQS